MRVPSPFPPGHPQGIFLSESAKNEALADNLEAEFQPVTDPSVPADTDMFDVALRSYFTTPASEPKLTNVEEVRESISVLKFSKAPGPNYIPYMDLKHLPPRAVSLLVLISMRSSSPITSLQCGSTPE